MTTDTGSYGQPRIYAAKRRASRGETSKQIFLADYLRCLISDHDPLFRFHQWQANLRVLEVRILKPCLTRPCRILS